MAGYPPEVEALCRFMTLKFLEGATVEDMRNGLREQGVPRAIWYYIPGMIYDATGAFLSVIQQQRSYEEAVEHLQQTGASREDVEYLLQLVGEGVLALREQIESDGEDAEAGDAPDEVDDKSEARDLDGLLTVTEAPYGSEQFPGPDLRCFPPENPDLPPFEPDFSRPEAALASIEEAYRRESLIDVLSCMDHYIEAGFAANTYMHIDHATQMREVTAEACRQKFLVQLAQRWPNFAGCTGVVTEIKELPGDLVICTEDITPPTGETFTQRMFVGLSREGDWKVVLPWEEKLETMWCDGMAERARQAGQA